MSPETLLLRQVHPSFIQKGRVSSQAFRPTPKDHALLSVYDGEQIEPAAAHQHYTDHQGLPSAGVMGVAVGECEALELSARPDPEPFPEHAVIDFSRFSRKATESKAKQLRARAEQRDWLYYEPGTR